MIETWVISSKEHDWHYFKVTYINNAPAGHER